MHLLEVLGEEKKAALAGTTGRKVSWRPAAGADRGLRANDEGRERTAIAEGFLWDTERTTRRARKRAFSLTIEQCERLFDNVKPACANVPLNRYAGDTRIRNGRLIFRTHTESADHRIE